MARFAAKTGVTAALAATALLGLAACSDPGATAATGASASQGSASTGASSSSSSAKEFNLTPQQDRIKVSVDPAAAALVPDAIKADGKLTVVTTGGTPPLSTFATDNKTLIGNEVDIAYAVGETLGLEVEVLPVAWADWPLGVESGKYEAVLSNVTVTEARKEKFDFATYRNDLLGFYAKADSDIGEVKEAKDVAGKRIIVGSGTNQEAILVRWDEENKKNGLKPVDFQYYDDDSASQLALQSGRADLTFGPNASAAYKAAKDGKTKEVGTVEGGWPLKAEIAFTTQKGNGLAVAAQAALNTLIKDGSYAKILDRWGLSSEAIPASELNPAGLPKK
ncbi:polar amino acid transport system substrate-binding protein [Paenarthrobacter nicotinovorans]|uniref:ABC transporter substrate-binding protein n=1 Tax=Paenarthrobacter nicotinovorans TaxID=29320 RepID=A0ABV0GSP0_PAENI|nr:MULTISPECIES: ABC transporter substrate-binding protein [Micrococcaceae]MDR6438537.1 polar amino acid transport system substrate-binding protein [Paenarthrobacter nicotinovorans]BCW60557.1 ABC transporter substrate-binding protein [Arthrobacter sp. StoSoilB20]SCZ60004.1 amino acid ABC transporter substrate-binding protein, PAAT family [Arthrobacter sp. UNCCL28]